MLPRTLEPEVMDTAEEAADYDSMDHSSVNRIFVDDLLNAANAAGFAERLSSRSDRFRVLDVGTGTAQIPIEFCRRPVSADIVAIDLAAEMLLLAEQNIREAGLHGSILLEHVDAKELPFDDGEFDWVISNSIVHHIPEPLDCLREMQRILKPGGLLFVRDLLRPDSSDQVEHLVQTYAGNDNDEQRQLFRQSLHAALTPSEMGLLMESLGWATTTVEQTSDRHWTVTAVALR
ncbi:MAG: ubiquinone/menaquinone biosynthesis C-methylase UbiE [Planctomycetaceae bacterium]|jgi:ubiquinone/menaquinone biosynthesis C-methylase UbiE